MKVYVFLAVAALALLQGRCKDEPTNSDASTAKPAEQAGDELSQIFESKLVLDSLTGETKEALRPRDALSTAIRPSNPITVLDKVKPLPQAPQPVSDQQKRIVRVLTTNYWVVFALDRIGMRESNRINQGAWFKFNPDGTYQYGQFERTIGSGAWSWEYRGDKAYLLLDSELLGDDREWQLLIGKDEDVMVWVGTPRYHTTDIQLKLQNLIQPARNRQEMGLD